MANLHLVTGFAGQEHVTSADQGAFNAAVMGSAQTVFEKGNQFAASIIDNNTVRVLDGELMMQGRYIRLNKDTYVDLTIENGAQGYLRNDLIVVRYAKDTVTAVESADLVVIKGEPAASNPADPEFTEGNILTESALQNDMPLFRVSINGLTIESVVPLFDTFGGDTLPGLMEAIKKNALDISGLVNGKAEKGHKHSASDITSGTLPVARGGTGAETAEVARKNLDVYSKHEVDMMADAVGTIKTTVRTDLGDDWLLCNGDILDTEAYPELAELLPAYPEGTWVKTSAFRETLPNFLVHEDGSAILASGSGGLRIQKTDDFTSGVWETIHEESYSYLSVNGFKYVNGYYFAFMTHQNGETQGAIYYSADLLNWTKLQNNRIYDIVWDGTHYFLCSTNGTSRCIHVYDSNFTQLGYKDVDQWQGSSSNLILCPDGGVISFARHYSSTAYWCAVKITVSETTIVETELYKGIPTDSSRYATCAFDGSYLLDDGRIATYTNYNGEKLYTLIFDPKDNTVSVNSIASSLSILGGNYSRFGNNSPDYIFFTTGGYSNILVSKKDGSYIAEVSLPTVVDYANIAFGSGKWVYYQQGSVYYLPVCVPVLSIGTAYSYIKGR